MSTPTYEEIQQQVQRRYHRWYWFIFHLIMAVTTTGAIWLIDPTPEDGSPVIAMLWAGVLVGHLAKIFMDGAQDRAVERMWRRYHGDVEKLKRHETSLNDTLHDEAPRTLRLTDDAELEVVEADVPPRRIMRGE